MGVTLYKEKAMHPKFLERIQAVEAARRGASSQKVLLRVRRSVARTANEGISVLLSATYANLDAKGKKAAVSSLCELETLKHLTSSAGVNLTAAKCESVGGRELSEVEQLLCAAWACESAAATLSTNETLAKQPAYKEDVVKHCFKIAKDMRHMRS